MSHTCFKITHCTHMIAEVLASDSFSTDHLAKSSIIFCYVWGKKRISILFWRGYMGIVVIVQSKKRLPLLLERALASQAIYLKSCGQACLNVRIGPHGCCK